MNSRNDIERVLDAWFVDGPSSMPDRLFDAVLDQVGRTPQRPLARLHLRLTTMSTNIRWLALAAAALAVAVVGVLAFGNRSPQSSVGASPTPAASATATAGAAVPTALRQIWMGPPKSIAGIAPEAGVTLVFSGASGFWMTQSASGNNHRLVSEASAAGEGRIELDSGQNVTDCPAGSRGTYAWTISGSGKTLTLAAESDDCPARLAAVPGDYVRMDCPTQEDNCLGPIDAGTYGSQFIDPFVTPGGTWAPRYGAVTYTVPSGWVNQDDWPTFLGLVPADAAPGTLIELVTHAVAPSADDACSETASDTIGRNAQALATWVATAPGVIPTTPTPLTISGRDAWRVDVSLDPAWTAPCPFSEGKPARVMFTADPAAGEGWAIGMLPGQRDRYYFVDVGGGRALLVQVEAASAEAFDGFIGEASGIVESLQLTP